MKKNKIILICPGEMGLYLKDKLPPLLFKLTKNIFLKLLKKKVTIPLSILGVGTYLKQEGFEVVLIDGRVEDSIERLRQELNNNILFVGISALTGSSITFGLFCADYIRKRDSKIPIVWGGVHVTLTPEQSLATSNLVDIVVKGEGEITGVELAKALQNNADLSNVCGISYKLNEKIYHNPDRLFMNFDEELELDYGMLNMDYYDMDRFLYQSERGCPHRCEFCDVLVVHRRKFRQKSAESVLRDLERINRLFRPQKIVFVDDCFFADFKRADKIVECLIEGKMDMQWHASCRASYFRKTNVDFWKKAKKSGLAEVYVGIESGSPKMLDYIKKDCTIEDILNGAKQIAEADILFMTNLLFGFPGETEEDIQMSLDLVKYLRKTYGKNMQLGRIFLYGPCPSTPMFFKVVKAGFVPPQTLNGWGKFRIGDPENLKWHPLFDYLSAVAICSHQGKPFDWRISLKRLRRINIPGIIIDFLGHLAWLRWENNYFKYPFDLKLIQLLEKYFYLW